MSTTATRVRDASASDVAAALLNALGPMTAMKLQKLCFYVQATSLGRDHRVAFDDDFQAWRDGPVVRSLYQRHRGYHVVDSIADGDPAVLDKRVRVIVADVVRRYGPLNATELSDISHREDPWRLTRGTLPAEASSEDVIPRELIESYYARQTLVDATGIRSTIGSAKLEGAQFSAQDENVIARFARGEITRTQALVALTGT